MNKTTSNLITVTDKIDNNSTLFKAGFKAEVYWGDEIHAHHMNTRSMYSFKKNTDVSITHDAPLNYDTDSFEDRFRVSVRKWETDRCSVTSTIATFSDFNSAYYVALEQLKAS